MNEASGLKRLRIPGPRQFPITPVLCDLNSADLCVPLQRSIVILQQRALKHTVFFWYVVLTAIGENLGKDGCNKIKEYEQKTSF